MEEKIREVDRRRNSFQAKWVTLVKKGNEGAAPNHVPPVSSRNAANFSVPYWTRSQEGNQPPPVINGAARKRSWTEPRKVVRVAVPAAYATSYGMAGGKRRREPLKAVHFRDPLVTVFAAEKAGNFPVVSSYNLRKRKVVAEGTVSFK